MVRCVSYFLLVWAVTARGQIFRLPTSSACQNSKKVTDLTQLSYFANLRNCSQRKVRQGLPLLLAGGGQGQKVDLGGGEELLQGLLHGLHQHQLSG